ncbi:MAG: RNA-binding cell elongation regulator Jag/EloR [Candidatus Izemoplasmataceae bacterium]
MKSIVFDIKSMNDALDYASKELRIQKDFIDINVLEKKGVLGLMKSYKVEATINVDPADLGYQTLKKLFLNMNVDAKIEMKQRKDNQLIYTIETDENPLLIGKNGKTLEGIQLFIRNLINAYTDQHMIVLVDIGGYRENRKKQLEILATKTAKEVARSKIAAKLEPMNAYERRIVHMKLSDWRDVSTVSEGEGSSRHLVIKPKRR